MRLEVYRDRALVAVFEYGREPVYHGGLGRLVRQLVETPHAVRGPRTGELVYRPGGREVARWEATIRSAPLAEAGFELRRGRAVTRRPLPTRPA